MKLRHAILFAALAIVPLVAKGAGFNAVVQGQSATAPGSHTATGVYISTSLLNWEELDIIPFRVSFTGGPVTGQVISVKFDHQKTLGSITNFGLQNLTYFTPSAGVTITSGPTLDTSDPDVWVYTFTINMSGTTGEVQFVGNLSAGAHNFGGASLNVGGTPSLGNLSIQKPAAAPGTPNLSVTKTGPATAVPGATVTYTLSYNNVSALPVPSAATGVQLYDTLPAGLTYVPGSASCTGTCTGAPAIAGNEIVWNLGTLPLGATGSQTFQATVSAAAPNGSTLLNTAIILSAENDAVPANNSSTFTTTVVATSTLLSVADATATYGGTVTLQATLTDVAASTGITGKIVSFSLNGTSVGSATTNGTGVATLSGVSVAGILVGTYPGAVEATFAGSAPYAGSNGTAQLQVNPRPLTITATDQSKVYGDTFTFTGAEFAATGLTGTDTVTAVTLASTGAVVTAAAGSYEIVPSNAVGTGLANYLITYTIGTLTVTGKPLTITAHNQSKTYGDNFTFAGTEFSVSGLTGIDTVTAVTLTSAGAPASAGAGTYDIIPSGATGTGLENYLITYVSGTLTVGAKPLTLAATNQSKTYGDTFTFAGTEFTASGLIGTDAVTSVTLTSVGAAAAAAAGDYDIVPSAASGAGLANYLISYTNGTMTVGARALTITAANQSKTYGDTFAFSGTEFTASGLAGSDSVTSVALSSLGTPATAAAGDYDIIPSGASGTGLDNYVITYSNGTMTVGAKALTITADNQSKIYGDTFTFVGTEFTTLGLAGADSVTAVTLTSSGAGSTAAVGNYDIVPSGATGTGLSNYLITYVNGTMTVAARTLTITAADQTKTYGDTFTFGGTEFSVLGLTGSDAVTAVTLTSAGAPATAAIGTYDIIPSAATGTGLGNYLITYINGTMTVTAKALTITATSQNKIYGDTFVFAGNEFSVLGLTGSDTVAAVALTSGGAPAGASTGAYDIFPSAATGTGLGNYLISYINGTMTVGARALTITAANQNKTYGDTFAFSGTEFTVSGLTGGDAVTAVTLSSTGAPATALSGTYDIVPSAAVGTGLSNYLISYINGTMTVGARALTITASNQNKTYGDAFTFAGTEFTVSGLTGTDIVVSVTLTSAGTPAAAVAGNYNIIPSSAIGAGLDNYLISYVNGTLTIGTRALTITANNQAKVYGQTFTFAGNEFTTTGLTGTDSVIAVNLSSAGADASAAAGSYDIVPSAATGSGLDNYVITYGNGTLVVGARGLTITANNQNKTYGTAFMFVGTEFMAAGLTGTDTVTSVSLTSAGMPAPAPVGAYDIVPSAAMGTGLGNYTITYVDGTMMVDAKALAITANNQTKSYGDTFVFSGSEFTAIGLAGTDSVTSVTLTSTGADATAPVGSYDILPSGAVGSGLANYVITYANGTLTVGVRAISITADPKAKLYGEADPPLTYQVTGGSLVAGDSFSGALSRAPGEDVGVYAISQGTVALNSNYALVFVGNNLTIGQRAVTITADAKSKVYGSADPVLIYQVTSGSLIAGDAFSGSLTRVSGENVGLYQIQQGTVALGGNYALTYIPANLSINQAMLNVTANDKSRSYGEANPVLDATYTGFVNGETLATSGVTGAPSLTTTAATTSPVGTYPITTSIGTLASLNYGFAFADGTLTVSGRAIVVTADAKSKVYNTSEPALTYQVTSGSLTPGDSFTGALIREPGENVGTYAIQQGTLALNGNYALTFIGATFTITKADQTISFPALLNKKFGDPAFNVAATATSSLPVSFGVISGPASIAGTLVTITGSGTVTIRAEQPGNENYNAAPSVERSLNVGKADQTITFASLPNRTFGDPPVPMTVSASSHLPVTCNVISGAGSVTDYYSVAIGGAGTIVVRATQDGNENYNAATPVEQSFVVGKANTVTGLTSAPNPSMLGEPVLFTAYISSAASGMTGTVQFKDNNKNLGEPQVVSGGKATLTTSTLGVGRHSISAEYSGDDNFFGSEGTLPDSGTGGQLVLRPAALLNLATRLFVRTNDDVMIGGFIMTGIVPKTVIVRGIGPSLVEADINGFMTDPVIELHGPDGALLVTNDNWRESQAGLIEASGLAPKNDLESAIIATLPPANYTVIIRGKDGGMGVGLVEVYDLDPMSESDLRNVSTRGYVVDGDNVLIGGFTLGTHQGAVPILIRALGPCLANWGLKQVLADPVLHLHDANGTMLIANDNWQEDPAQATAILQTQIPPEKEVEAAAVITLQPGAYTVIVQGKNGAIGNGIVEVYPLN